MASLSTVNIILDIHVVISAIIHKKLTCDKDVEWSHDTNGLCCKFLNTVVNIIQNPKQICVLAIYIKIAIDNVKILKLIHNNNNQYINGLIAKYPSIIQCC